MVTLAQAQSDGFEITFVGLYKESRAAKPSVKRIIPFVVAQTPDQKAQLDNGVLEGRIYDLDCYASIEQGMIDQDKVQFIKKYQPSEIGEILNPNPIRYGGFGQGDGKYMGNWSYTPETRTGNMMTHGTFTMIRITSAHKS